jgi:hypothetical protein
MEKITAWVTKHALTRGILTVDAEVYDDGCISWRGSSMFVQYAHGKDWHRTQAAALARAEEMRAKKIASLRKKIAALKRLQFKL